MSRLHKHEHRATVQSRSRSELSTPEAGGDRTPGGKLTGGVVGILGSGGGDGEALLEIHDVGTRAGKDRPRWRKTPASAASPRARLCRRWGSGGRCITRTTGRTRRSCETRYHLWGGGASPPTPLADALPSNVHARPRSARKGVESTRRQKHGCQPS